MTQNQEKTHNIIQGEHAVSGDENLVITTILGSCVAACIYDPVLKIGGANHFLLPDAGAGASDIRYAAAAMEVLINSLVRAGAQKRRMEAKLFGGARILANLPDIGRSNALAAEEFLRAEGIPVVARDVGGSLARRLRFSPTTGRVRIQRLDPQNSLPPETPRPTRTQQIELFN